MMPKKSSRYSQSTLPNVLFASDIQLDSKNLHHFKTVVQDLKDYAERYRVDTLFLLGDIKDPTSPIPGGVINAAVEGFRELKQTFPVIVCLLGNHDYYSPSGGESWAGFLKQCGLIVVSEPNSCFGTCGRVFALIPYQHSKEKFVSTVKEFAKNPADVLLFHQGLNRAQLNMLTVASDEIDPALLNAFPLAIGGHYHHQHRVPDTFVWYCGSPFCSRWDEANQTKGYLLLNGRNEVVQLPSSIPGWYDASWPNFPAKLPVGARVRVPLEYGKEPPSDEDVEFARKDAIRELGVVNVEVRLKQKDLGYNYKPPIESEAEAVSHFYSALNSPHAAEAQQMLTEALSGLKTSALPHMDVLSVEAVNTLQYERVRFDFETGLHVIHGANGSGKTSLLHLLPAALFGETLKGQSGPELRRENSTGNSYVTATVKNCDGQTIEVTRSRSPQFVRIMVDGKDVTEGGAANLKHQVYQYTGYTLEMLRAALYVDQRIVSGLLRGEPAEQRMLLNAFCGLERYAAAAKRLKADLATMQRFKASEAQTVAGLKARLKARAEQRWQALAINRKIEAEQRVNTAELQAKLDSKELQLADLSMKYEALRASLKSKQTDVNVADAALTKARNAWMHVKAQLAAMTEPNEFCPVCGASTNAELLKKLKADYQAKRQALNQQAQDRQQEITALSQTLKNYTVVADEVQQSMQAVQSEHHRITAEAMSLRSEIKRCQTPNLVPVPSVHKDKLQLVLTQGHLDDIDEDMTVCNAAIAACDTKTGVPAMLVQQLVPRLNGAARAVSSELETPVQVQFEMLEDALKVKVHNEDGGSSLHSQSNGETQLATTIVTLALRSLVQSNLLILDEPSLGLDVHNSQHLASVINSLKRRYRTILVVSHDSNFAQYLEVTRLWKTEKKKGVCTLS